MGIPSATGSLRRWGALASISCLLVVAARPLSAGVVYFQVTERPGQAVHDDSFILPLSDPLEIQHARDLIQHGPDVAGASIVFAHIDRGSAGVNLDLLDPDRRAWSWHVSQFEGFNDFGIELIDSWPTYVEDHLDSWLQQTHGEIGFWSYTVTRELPGPPTAAPLPNGALAGGALLGTVATARWIHRRRVK